MLFILMHPICFSLSFFLLSLSYRLQPLLVHHNLQVFNVFLVLIQFVFTNIFLHNRFSFYGPQVVFLPNAGIWKRSSMQVLFYYRLPEEEQALQKNPMCWTFPRLGIVRLHQSSFFHQSASKKINLPQMKALVSTFAASCNYWRWGPGGMQENINAICVLALNMINDKVT